MQKVMNIGSFDAKSYFGTGLWSISYKTTSNFKSYTIKTIQQPIFKKTIKTHINLICSI